MRWRYFPEVPYLILPTSLFTFNGALYAITARGIAPLATPFRRRLHSLNLAILLNQFKRKIEDCTNFGRGFGGPRRHWKLNCENSFLLFAPQHGMATGWHWRVDCLRCCCRAGTVCLINYGEMAKSAPNWLPCEGT